jgi:hypothetical protein
MRKNLKQWNSKYWTLVVLIFVTFVLFWLNMPQTTVENPEKTKEPTLQITRNVKEEKRKFFVDMLHNYKKFHHQMLTEYPNDAKYARCWTNAGWGSYMFVFTYLGNRFQHTLSCVLFAILSNRVAIFPLDKSHEYFYGNFYYYFDEPFIAMFKYDAEKLPKTEVKSFVGSPLIVSCTNATDIESNVQILDVIRKF